MDGVAAEAGSKNANLNAAMATKNDEFYTQWVDIEREMHRLRTRFGMLS